MTWPFLLKHRVDEKGVRTMKKVLVAAGVLAALVAAGVVVLKKSGFGPSAVAKTPVVRTSSVSRAHRAISVGSC